MCLPSGSTHENKLSSKSCNANNNPICKYAMRNETQMIDELDIHFSRFLSRSLIMITI